MEFTPEQIAELERLLAPGKSDYKRPEPTEEDLREFCEERNIFAIF